MNPPFEIEVSSQFITPELAEALLQNNTCNRRPKRSTITAIKRDILSGNYKLNGESIIVASNGRLLDGQNRLMAVVECASGIWSVIVRGIPENCYDTIDSGLSRKVADALTISGEKHASILSPTVSLILALRGGKPINQRATAPETEVFIESEPVIRREVDRVKSMGKLLISNALATALLHEFSAISTPLANEWLDSIRVESAELATPINSSAFRILKDRLTGNAIVRRKLGRQVILALCIKAWNAALCGEEVKGLKYARGEKFPEINSSKSKQRSDDASADHRSEAPSVVQQS